MAKRPVFVIKSTKPFYEEVPIEFTYYSGFAISQKQKSIHSLHENFNEIYPERKILEISTKSKSGLGEQLSAFRLRINASKGSFYLENAFQSSKVFENGGPYTDLLKKEPKEAKKDERLRNSGKLIEFNYKGRIFPLEPKTYFYDWLYINTVNLSKDLLESVLEYSAFSDIEFNPEKSLNCQARSIAILVSLKKNNLLDVALESPKAFLDTIYYNHQADIQSNENQIRFDV